MDFRATAEFLAQTGWLLLAILAIGLAWLRFAQERSDREQLHARLAEREHLLRLVHERDRLREVAERALYAGGQFPVTDAFLGARKRHPWIEQRRAVARWFAPPVEADPNVWRADHIAGKDGGTGAGAAATTKGRPRARVLSPRVPSPTSSVSLAGVLPAIPSRRSDPEMRNPIGGGPAPRPNPRLANPEPK